MWWGEGVTLSKDFIMTFDWTVAFHFFSFFSVHLTSVRLLKDRNETKRILFLSAGWKNDRSLKSFFIGSFFFFLWMLMVTGSVPFLLSNCFSVFLFHFPRWRANLSKENLVFWVIPQVDNQLIYSPNLAYSYMKVLLFLKSWTLVFWQCNVSNQSRTHTLYYYNLPKSYSFNVILNCYTVCPT